MIKTNKVSVAMAAYNGEQYIQTQIESILNDLSAMDELVVSYNISSDNTLDILKSLAIIDDRIRVIENPKSGVVANFTYAITNCVGDIIFISDQDDVWVSGKRNACVNALTSANADLVIHNGVHINKNGEILTNPFFDIYRIGPGLIRNFLKPRYSGCCMAFRKSALKLIVPMPEYVINYDHWIGMVCECFGRVIYLDEVLLEHRLHESNVTTNRRPLPVIVEQRWHLAHALLKKGRQLND